MAKVKATASDHSKSPMRPALTPDSRENQMISLAMDLVEKRLMEGTASSQETTHFLKLAASTTRLENELKEKQKELMEAKSKALQSAEDIKKLYEDAITAMRKYSGHGDSDGD